MRHSTARRRAIRLFIFIALVVSVMPLQMMGCDGSPSAADEDIEGTVSDNHGHRAIITAEQLNLREAVSLDITGDADHAHTLDLTADEVEAVLEGDEVAKESSLDSVSGSHSHVVTFN